MRKNFINKILMLFEVSHSFYFILHKPMGKRSRAKRQRQAKRERERAGVVGGGWWKSKYAKQPLGCLRMMKMISVSIHIAWCVCLGFSFSWPTSSAFRMLCTPSVLCIVYVYLFCCFFGLPNFSSSFFFGFCFYNFNINVSFPSFSAILCARIFMRVCGG